MAFPRNISTMKKSMQIPSFPAMSFRFEEVDRSERGKFIHRMIMTSQKEGLWAHFIDLIPMPERSEYLSLIGRSLMDTNEV